MCKLLKIIWGCLHFLNSSCLTVFPLRNIWTCITEFDSFVFVFFKQVGVFMGEVFICIYWGSVVSEEKANVIPPIRFFHLFHHTSPVRPLRTSVQNFSIAHETHLQNLFNFCILKIQLTRRPEKNSLEAIRSFFSILFEIPLIIPTISSLVLRYYYIKILFLQYILSFQKPNFENGDVY